MDADQLKQNLLGMEAAMADSIKADKTLDLAGTLWPFAARRPVSGEWYFSGSCKHCSAATPYLKDTSGGVWNKFTTPFQLSAPCAKCGKPAVSDDREIRSVQWP